MADDEHLGARLLAQALRKLVEDRAQPGLSARPSEPPLSMLVPAWILVAACVYFGLETSFNVGAAQAAAEFLLRGPR